MIFVVLLEIIFMSIFSDIFKKHGHRKEEEIQELLKIIKQMEVNEGILEREILHLTAQNEKLFNLLEKCRHPKKRHGATFNVVFN